MFGQFYEQNSYRDYVTRRITEDADLFISDLAYTGNPVDAFS